MFASAIGSLPNLSFLSQQQQQNDLISPSISSSSSLTTISISCLRKSSTIQRLHCSNTKASIISANNNVVETQAQADGNGATIAEDSSPPTTTPLIIEHNRIARRSADWKAARAYKESGAIYEGRIEGSNNGGLLVRFYSILGFLPYPLLSPSHSCAEPLKSVQGIGKDLVGSTLPLKVIQVSEESRKLIFSERDAIWSKFGDKIKVGDIFFGIVGSLEEYGAFVHLLFPDGKYHITGLVHISEVSWDLVQDVRDVLNEGDEVRVKVMKLDLEKTRATLSIKQLEEDPLLETLDKVIPEKGQLNADTSHMPGKIEPLPGLDTICKGLLEEAGITAVRISRQGFEKRVVSQDLQLWLSNEPAVGNQFTLLARAGRQVQEIQLRTTLDQEGIKKALQRVLERVP
ncbi:hypothetical protein ACHQM5_028102 [Ranunculus cassubicifolius]